MLHDDLPAPESVATRAQLAAYVDRLHDALRADPDAWENPTLDRYLEALSTYLRDVPGYLKNVNSSIDPEKPSWELFALVLLGASVYE
jgi:hypothetical protein